MSQGVGRMFCLPKTAWPPTCGFHGPIHFDADSRVLTITDIVLNDASPITTVTVSGEIHFT